MPYEISSKGKKFILSNKETGRVIAAHDTKKKAQDQMKAIYANENLSGASIRAKGNVILDGK